MATDLTMPALSPTMEKGTLARWLVAVGDTVKPGDVLAEIETDKATMEFEAVDEGTIAEIVVQNGTDGVPVGATLARLVSGDQQPTIPGSSLSPSARRAAKETGIDPASVVGTGRDGRVTKQDLVAASTASPPPAEAPVAATQAGETSQESPAKPAESARPAPRLQHPVDPTLSPLIRRIAAAKGLDAKSLIGSGADGKILLADVAPSIQAPAAQETPAASTPAKSATLAKIDSAPRPVAIPDIPHDTVKLSGMRKTIARRLTESKQQVPHIYLSVDVGLDALLALRSELNEALLNRGIKLSVNDLIIKAQALALLATPACNVQYTPETLICFSRADISVAVSIPDGLITPIIVDAGSASLSTIATSMKDLAERARAGKLQPSEYQGGTASLSNLGMFGIKQFDAVINPPQAMILAVGAGERRVIIDGENVGTGTAMTATGSFDHRAIDGADAAAFMNAFRSLVENPLRLIS